MTAHGTRAYDGREGLPPLVAAAVELARRTGFALSCLPAQGALLRVLAGGVPGGGGGPSGPDGPSGPRGSACSGVIGETGTGCGVGLAWLASGAAPGTRLISVERDGELAAAACGLFAGDPRVTVLTGDWTTLAAHGPFDLLVLDGGGQGKAGEPPLEPARWLRPGGLLVIDDFTPLDGWPPTYAGVPDTARLYWLRHPGLLATEVRVAPDSATIVATYPGPGYPEPVADSS